MTSPGLQLYYSATAEATDVYDHSFCHKSSLICKYINDNCIYTKESNEKCKGIKSYKLCCLLRHHLWQVTGEANFLLKRPLEILTCFICPKQPEFGLNIPGSMLNEVHSMFLCFTHSYGVFLLKFIANNQKKKT